MKLKGILFAGIILLIVGIVLRKATQLELIGLALILVGVIMKISYIIIKAKRGEYRPGKELILLMVGLVFFFTGLYLRNTDPYLTTAIYLIVLGIALKVAFIIGFIRNVRFNKRKAVPD